MELGCYHIEYEPRTTLKGQVLTDFIIEFTDDSIDTTGGQSETTVALVDQTAAPTGGQEDNDMMQVDNEI